MDADPTMGGGYGERLADSATLLRVRNEAEGRDKDDRQRNLPSTPQATSSLAAHILTRFRDLQQNRADQEERMLDALRRRRGQYDASTLARIAEEGGTDYYLKLTELQCNAAEHWLCDVLGQAEDKPWTLEPTPLPDLPEPVRELLIDQALKQALQSVPDGAERGPDFLSVIHETAEKLRDAVGRHMLAEAQGRGERMERLIDDQMTEGRFSTAFRECITDLCTTGTCVLKGPFIVREPDLTWTDDFKPQVTERLRIQFCRVDPLDMFPAAGAVDIEDLDLIERMFLTRTDLWAMQGLSGVNDAELREALTATDIVGVPAGTDEDEKDTLEQQPDASDNPEVVRALEYHGRVSGELLSDWGMSGLEAGKTYEITALLVGHNVVKAVLNQHPLGLRPYSKASFRKIVGSWWGEGPPMLMSDVQDLCNSAARDLCNNMGLASGPILGVQTSALTAGQTLTTLRPWMILQFDEAPNGNIPWEVKDIASHAAEFLAILDKWMPQAGERTGIPPYAYGSDETAGPAKTATGLSMLMSTAARGIKGAILSLDQGVIERVVRMLYVHNLLYSERTDIKGDLRVAPHGAIGLFLREQKTLRLQEFTRMVQSDQPLRVQLGPRRYMELLRQNAKVLDLPVDDILPSDDDLAMEAAAASASPGALLPALPSAAGASAAGETMPAAGAEPATVVQTGGGEQ